MTSESDVAKQLDASFSDETDSNSVVAIRPLPIPVAETNLPVRHSSRIAADKMDLDAVKVIRRLNRHGYTAYLVGGGVRDLLLGIRPKDFDIATNARPQEVRELFRNCRVIGRRFRLAHVLFAKNKIIEVATFRRTPFSDMGVPTDDNGSDSDLLIRNDNVYGDPHEDAQRRDFTINGLMYDLEHGEVIDYVGGLSDIERRVIRTIGDPYVRFREDPVRILRAIKFSARLDMGLDPDLYDATVTLRGELARAAKPRVLEEVLRLLRGGAAMRSIYLAWDMGVLAMVLPELSTYLDDHALVEERTWKRLAAIDQRVHEGKRPSDAVLLAALLQGPLEETMFETRNPTRAFDHFMEDLVLRMALPRRIKERIKILMLLQHRARHKRSLPIRNRELLEDATALFALESAPPH